MNAQILLTISRILGLLPLRFLWSLGRAAGAILYKLSRREAKIVDSHKRYLADQKLEISHQAVAAALGQSLFEQSALLHWPLEKILAHTRVAKGQEILERIKANNKAVLFLMPHLGGWEWMGPYLASEFGLMAMAKPARSETAQTLIKHQRERFGTQTVPTNANGVRSMLKWLKAGGKTLILPDQTPNQSAGSIANFFGRPALTVKLPYQIARSAQCEVVIASALREQEGIAFYFEELAKPSKDCEINDYLSLMNSAIAETIRRAPEQYIWNYRRFRSNGEAVYDFTG